METIGVDIETQKPFVNLNLRFRSQSQAYIAMRPSLELRSKA
jgi:hypothetical protein